MGRIKQMDKMDNNSNSKMDKTDKLPMIALNISVMNVHKLPINNIVFVVKWFTCALKE